MQAGCVRGKLVGFYDLRVMDAVFGGPKKGMRGGDLRSIRDLKGYDPP
jgi:hypothetical protein